MASSKPGVKRAAAAEYIEMAAAMLMEEEAPPPKRGRLEKLPLDMLGVAELCAYIEELREEIARVEADIARKQNHRAAADAVFRKG
jgi:uncharacterized small protein (DUF1192 family)